MNKYKIMIGLSALITLMVVACAGNAGQGTAPSDISPASLQVVPADPETNLRKDEPASAVTAPDVPELTSAVAQNAATMEERSGSSESANISSAPTATPIPVLEPQVSETVTSAEAAAPSVPEVEPATATQNTVTKESSASVTSGGVTESSSAAETKSPSEEAFSGPAIDTQRLMAQVFTSPSLQSCLSSKLGLDTLLQISSRQPTDKEATIVFACLDGETETPAPAPASSGGSQADSKTLLAQALDSPGLMWCLSGSVGMETVVAINDRAPTDSETSMIQRCLNDAQEIAAWNEEWPKRVDAAFQPQACDVQLRTDYPSSYYKGQLIDSHLHLPQLPDDFPGGPDDSYQAPRGSESDQYDTIAEADRPLMGRNVTVNNVACTLKNEGTIKAFTFFPVFPEITSPAIDVAYRTVQENQSLFVPFIQASANGVATLEGDLLDVMLGIRPDFFFGFGEVGDSPTEPINPKPDSAIYTGDFEVARNHGIPVYFHVGPGDQENMARALERFPDVDFIVHGDFVRPHIDDLMNRYPNIYFTFNDIFDEHIPLFRFGDKQTFMTAMEQDWDRLLDQAIATYKPMIEAHPDRYMWGTDRGDIVWNYDEDLGRLLADYGRAFIGRFDPSIQEDLAYKNAERLMEGSKYAN